jgi:hypothetical protein
VKAWPLHSNGALRKHNEADWKLEAAAEVMVAEAG